VDSAMVSQPSMPPPGGAPGAAGAPRSNRLNFLEQLELKYSGAAVHFDSDSQESNSVSNPSPATRKRHRQGDKNAWYDLDDGFIDDSDLVERERVYTARSSTQTKHDGFFVNTGDLKVTDQVDQYSGDSPSKRKRRLPSTTTVQLTGRKRSRKRGKKTAAMHTKDPQALHPTESAPPAPPLPPAAAAASVEQPQQVEAAAVPAPLRSSSDSGDSAVSGHGPSGEPTAAQVTAKSKRPSPSWDRTPEMQAALDALRAAASSFIDASKSLSKGAIAKQQFPAELDEPLHRADARIRALWSETMTGTAWGNDHYLDALGSILPFSKNKLKLQLSRLDKSHKLRECRTTEETSLVTLQTMVKARCEETTWETTWSKWRTEMEKHQSATASISATPPDPNEAQAGDHQLRKAPREPGFAWTPDLRKALFQLFQAHDQRVSAENAYRKALKAAAPHTPAEETDPVKTKDLRSDLFRTTEAMWPLGSMPRKRLIGKLNAEKKAAAASTPAGGTSAASSTSTAPHRAPPSSLLPLPVSTIATPSPAHDASAHTGQSSGSPRKSSASTPAPAARAEKTAADMTPLERQSHGVDIAPPMRPQNLSGHAGFAGNATTPRQQEQQATQGALEEAMSTQLGTTPPAPKKGLAFAHFDVTIKHLRVGEKIQLKDF